MGNLVAIIAVLAIFISCPGLFGLASFTAEQRIKEIGVRKVLGASVFNLWQLLSKDFLVLVLLSCAIAIPVGWYFMNDWLKNYQYKASINIGVFCCSGAGSNSHYINNSKLPGDKGGNGKPCAISTY